MSSPSPARQPLEAYKKAAEGFLARQLKDSRYTSDLSDTVPQTTQQRIAQDSLTLLQRRRPGFTIFGEMMIVYDDNGRLRHVTPDTSVALLENDDPQRRSWNWEHESALLLLTMDYLTDSENFETQRRTYEQLKIPYCVVFRPTRRELHVLRHNGTSLRLLSADPHGRYEIPELDLKLGIFSGWIRFWHRNRLLPIAEEQDVQLEEKDMLIYEQTAQIEDLKEVIADQTAATDMLRQELSEVHAWLRQRIERKARAAGRDDLIRQLDDSVPLEQLEAWLDELP